MDNNILIINHIIDKAINYFLERINDMSKDGPLRKYRKIPPTFSMLKLANDEFYEYAYFERVLERFVREDLINPIFCDLLAIHGIESKQPDSKNFVCYETTDFENGFFPFEFTFIYNGESVGVRYTSLCGGEAGELMKKHEVDKIIQIKWREELTARDIEQNEYDIVTPETFFSHYFTPEEYDIFMSKVMPAIEAANMEIGFETIPKLSLRYLSNFKIDINISLSSIDFEKRNFKMLPGSNEKKSLDETTFSTEDHEILSKNFKQRGLYKALLGTEGFAKCFITSEHLFQVFKQGNNFDYTSIVCGYLKAVEQLLYKLILINLDHNSNEDLWIQKKNNMPKSECIEDKTVRRNPKTNRWQVKFAAEYKDYFDTSLTPMIWFLHDNVNGWEISEAGRIAVHDFLLNFASECRNDFFHKDNIEEFSTASRIRDNATLIFYLLLGGYKLTGDHKKDLEVLGITDYSFDRLYKKIQEIPSGISDFIIYFSDKESIKAYRHFKQDSTVYDENGSLALSNIKFVEVDKFSMAEYNKAMQGEYTAREFTLRKDNMPAKISFINGKGEEVSII